MTEKSLLEKVKIVLGLVTETEVKLAEAMLQDGETMVQAESFEVGMPLNIVAQDGTLSPAPEGEHILADGTKIVVDANGIMTEVVEVKEEEEKPEVEVVVEQAEEDKDEKEYVAKADFDEMVAKIAKLEEALLMASQTVETVETLNKELTEKVEQLSASPAGNPIKSKAPVPTEEPNALKGLLKRK